MTRTRVMGILNVTPDSFSDGGLYLDPDLAIARAHQMVQDGADLIDIGGESTRPGSRPVDDAEQIRRVVPIIATLVGTLRQPISVDTRSARVAREALAVGATWVNDVSALRDDPALGSQIAEAEAGVVLMHMQGTPATMQNQPAYADVVAEVSQFLADAIERAERAGIPRDRIIVDPGIGFGKTLEQNVALIRAAGRFRTLGCPVLIGPSRKAFIGQILDLPVEERLEGTAAAVAMAVSAGAEMVRVHDVAAMVRVVRVTEAICRAAGPVGRVGPVGTVGTVGADGGVSERRPSGCS